MVVCPQNAIQDITTVPSILGGREQKRSDCSSKESLYNSEYFICYIPRAAIGSKIYTIAGSMEFRPSQFPNLQPRKTLRAQTEIMKIFTARNIFLSVSFLANAVSSAKISLGSFRSRDHDVAGDVFLKSERVLEIQNFVYDGGGTSNRNVATKHLQYNRKTMNLRFFPCVFAAPAVRFWADSNPRPSGGGFALEDGAPTNSCGMDALPRSQGVTYQVEFPPGTTIKDILGGSISIWCTSFEANFGEIVIPESLDNVVPTEEGPALQCS